MNWGKHRFARHARFFINAGALVKGIMGSIVTVIICTIMSTDVAPVLINGSDGGIVQTVLPIVQAALLIGGIFAAIGILYVVASSSFSGNK